MLDGFTPRSSCLASKGGGFIRQLSNTNSEGKVLQQLAFQVAPLIDRSQSATLRLQGSSTPVATICVYDDGHGSDEDTQDAFWMGEKKVEAVGSWMRHNFDVRLYLFTCSFLYSLTRAGAAELWTWYVGAVPPESSRDDTEIEETTGTGVYGLQSTCFLRQI